MGQWYQSTGQPTREACISPMFYSIFAFASFIEAGDSKLFHRFHGGFNSASRARRSPAGPISACAETPSGFPPGPSKMRQASVQYLPPDIPESVRATTRSASATDRAHLHLLVLGRDIVRHAVDHKPLHAIAGPPVSTSPRFENHQRLAHLTAMFDRPIEREVKRHASCHDHPIQDICSSPRIRAVALTNPNRRHLVQSKRPFHSMARPSG